MIVIIADAEREQHRHVVDWLKRWEAAGRPTKGSTAPDPVAMDRDGAAATTFSAYKTEGCYVGACIVPCIVTSFCVQANTADSLRVSGCSLVGVPVR